MTLQAGQSLGKFQILGALGSGGMAMVYKAYQPSLDREVALKVLRGGYAEDKEFVARFEREARAIARLRHPNIVQVFDFEEVEGRYVLAMEYLEGGTLKDRQLSLAREGKGLDPQGSVRIIAEVASALAFAHDRQIVHRDVKPSNVMLAEGDRAVVTDFGIAKMLEGQTSHTQTGVGIGTPEYMSPEQGQASKAIDHRADIYSLGVMAYEMLTGRLPFTADTPLAVVLAHIRDPLPLPSVVNPTIGKQTERALLKALAKDPAQRFNSARDFATALADGLAADTRVGALPTVTHGAGALAASHVSRAPSSRSLSIPLPAIAGRPPLLAAAVIAGLIVVSGIGFAVTRITASPASVGSAEPASIDPIPKGALYYEAKLDGTQGFIRPGTLRKNARGGATNTDPEAVVLRTPAGAVEIANQKPLSQMEFAFDAPIRQNYVAELDIESPQGGKTVAEFFLRRAAPGGGEYWLGVSPEGAASVQYNPGTGAAATQRIADRISLPTLSGGRKVTLAIVVEDTRFTIFGDGRQYAQVVDSRVAPLAQPLIVSNYSTTADATGTLRITRARFFELDRSKVAPLAAATPVGSAQPSPAPVAPGFATPPKFAIPAKGTLVFEAKLDGAGAEMRSPNSGGERVLAEVRHRVGSIDITMRPDSGLNGEFSYRIPDGNRYVGEMDLEFSANADMYFEWAIRHTSTGQQLLLQLRPPLEGLSASGIISGSNARLQLAEATISGLRGGRALTVAVVADHPSYHVFIDQQERVSFTMPEALANTGTGTRQGYHLVGSSGIVRITGIRYYALP